MAEINQVALTAPNTGMQIPLSVRQKLLADQLLGQQASSTAPIRHPAAGFARIAGGALDGFMEKSELEKEEAAEKTSMQNMANLYGERMAGAASPVAPAAASGSPAASRSGAGARSAPNPAGSQDGNATGMLVANELTKRGVKPDVAAGAVGSLMGESGQSLNPGSIRPNDAGPGLDSVGLGQWNRERLNGPNGLFAFAGLDPNSKSSAISQVPVATQAQFIGHELDTTHAGTLAALKAGATPADGTNAWTDSYEGAQGGSAAHQDRIPLGQNFAAYMQQQAMKPPDTPQSLAANPSVAAGKPLPGGPMRGIGRDDQGNPLFNTDGSPTAAGLAYRASEQATANGPKAADLPAAGAQATEMAGLPPGVPDPWASSQDMSPLSALGPQPAGKTDAGSAAPQGPLPGDFGSMGSSEGPTPPTPLPMGLRLANALSGRNDQSSPSMDDVRNAVIHAPATGNITPSPAPPSPPPNGGSDPFAGIGGNVLPASATLEQPAAPNTDAGAPTPTAPPVSPAFAGLSGDEMAAGAPAPPPPAAMAAAAAPASAAVTSAMAGPQGPLPGDFGQMGGDSSATPTQAEMAAAAHGMINPPGAQPDTGNGPVPDMNTGGFAENPQPYPNALAQALAAQRAGPPAGPRDQAATGNVLPSPPPSQAATGNVTPSPSPPLPSPANADAPIDPFHRQPPQGLAAAVTPPTAPPQAAPAVIPAPAAPPPQMPPQALAQALGAPSGRNKGGAQSPTEFNVAQAGSFAPPPPAPPQLAPANGAVGKPGLLASLLGGSSPATPDTTPGSPTAGAAPKGISPAQYAVLIDPRISPEAKQAMMAPILGQVVPDGSSILNPRTGTFTQPPVEHKFIPSRVPGMPPIDEATGLPAPGNGSAQTSAADFEERNAEARKIGEDAAGRMNTMQTQADVAQEHISRLETLRTLAAQTKSGPLAGDLGKAGAIAQELGIPDGVLKAAGIDPNLPTDAQILQKLAANMVTESIGAKNGGFPASNFSVAERQFIESSLPNIGNNPGANAAIVDMMEAKEKNNQFIGQQWGQYQQNARDAGATPSFAQFEQAYNTRHGRDDIYQPFIDKYKSGGYGTSPVAGAAPVAQAAPAGAKPPPAVGTIQQGHQFMGGDPSQPSSWKAVQ